MANLFEIRRQNHHRFHMFMLTSTQSESCRSHTRWLVFNPSLCNVYYLPLLSVLSHAIHLSKTGGIRFYYRKLSDLLVLDDFEPSFLIKPYYPPGKRVELGNRLKPQAVARRPIISVSSLKPSKTVKSNTTYTVVLSDPDATSRAHPVKAQMCHWIISQIIPSSASHGHTDLIDLGTALSLGSDDGLFEIESYFPPAPPPKTGYHRYVFALLTSDSESLPKKPKDRPHWGYGKVGAGIREWARENELEVVGK